MPDHQRICRNTSPIQLLRHVRQYLSCMRAQVGELLPCQVCGAADRFQLWFSLSRIILCKRCWNVDACKMLLHGGQHTAFLEHDAVHQILLIDVLLQLGILLAAATTTGQSPGRHIQHAGGHCPTVFTLRLGDGKQVQQHLHVHPIQQLSQVKFLLPGFVVDDPDIPGAVFLI